VAGVSTVPTATRPLRPERSVITSWWARFISASAARARRIMISPYGVGVTPRGRRSNSSAPSNCSSSDNILDAAGCVMFAAMAACRIDRCSPSSPSSTRWRVFRRERMKRSDCGSCMAGRGGAYS